MVIPKLLLLVPSRERPKNAHRLNNYLNQDKAIYTYFSTVFVLDYDDPSISLYPKNYYLVSGGNMVKALNEAALFFAPKYQYIAFLGDDTLPQGDWFKYISNELTKKKNSIVYGNDLIHGERLPTSVFMDSNIINTLGYMAPVNQKQLFVDNYWKALGEELGTLSYLPHVIIEHLHPLVGKAESDHVYEKGYSAQRWQEDQDAFELHMKEQFPLDIKKLQEQN